MGHKLKKLIIGGALATMLSASTMALPAAGAPLGPGAGQAVTTGVSMLSRSTPIRLCYYPVYRYYLFVPAWMPCPSLPAPGPGQLA